MSSTGELRGQTPLDSMVPRVQGSFVNGFSTEIIGAARIAAHHRTSSHPVAQEIGCDSSENLITVCAGCHATLHGNCKELPTKFSGVDNRRRQSEYTFGPSVDDGRCGCAECKATNSRPCSTGTW